MIKHIAGVTLFTFIVGIFAFVAWILQPVKFETVKPHFVSRTYQSPYKSYCSKKKYKSFDIKSVEITQAVYDQESKLLTTNLEIETGSRFSKDISLNLHFFVKDKFSTRFLKTERIFASTHVKSHVRSFEFLNNLSSQENLYVIPEVRNNYSGFDKQPFFDAEKAAPILLKSID